MDIMLTIHPWKGREKALEIVKELKRLQIRKARINLKTLYRAEHFDELFSFLGRACQIDNEIEWYFDIGIPGDTLRLVIPNKPYNFFVDKGERVRVYFSNCNNYENDKKVYIRKPCILYSATEIFQRGKTLLYADGEIEFRISECYDDSFEAIALNRGTIWDGKAIYPSNKIITQYESLSYLLKYIDTMPNKERNFIVCSMVEDANQITVIRDMSRMKIISKIETSLGIEHLESIANVSDGVMLGRGDLFLDSDNCLHYWKLQQSFLDFISKDKNINSIVATDILDSFKDNRVPTRSDITDVFYLMAHHPKVLCLSASIFYSNNLEKCISVFRGI